MQRQRFGILVVAVLLAASGCAPVVYTSVPQISGRVVDVHGQPVPRASVTVTDALDPQSPFALVIPCHDDGSFSRPADTSWGIFIVGADAFGTHFKAVAGGDGSRSAPQPFGGDWAQVRLLGLGSVDQVDLGAVVVRQSPSSLLCLKARKIDKQPK